MLWRRNPDTCRQKRKYSSGENGFAVNSLSLRSWACDMRSPGVLLMSAALPSGKTAEHALHTVLLSPMNV